MTQRAVVRPGKLGLAVGFVSLLALVSMTSGVLLSSPHDTERVILGLGAAVMSIFVAHTMLNQVVVDASRVVIVGQAFRREFPASRVVAANIDVFLTFYLDTGEIAVVQFVNCDGLFAPLLKRRARRVVELVQRTLRVESIASPNPGTDPPWDKGPLPASRVVKRSINWPSPWLLTVWASWLIGIFIYRGH